MEADNLEIPSNAGESFTDIPSNNLAADDTYNDYPDFFECYDPDEDLGDCYQEPLFTHDNTNLVNLNIDDDDFLYHI